MNTKKIIEKIKEAERIAVLVSRRADLDAAGTGLAVFEMLKNLNKDIKIFSPFDVKATFPFLPKCEEAEIFEPDKTDLSKFPLIIVLDAAEIEQLSTQGDKQVTLPEESFIINIDHHKTNTNFGDINIVKEYTSTAEIIYELFKSYVNITKDIATNLLAALLSDSLNLLTDETRPESYKIAGELLALGADRELLVNEYFYYFEIKDLRFLGDCFQKLRVEQAGNAKFAYVYLDKDFLSKYNLNPREREIAFRILKGYLSGISNIDFSLVIRELEDSRKKLSFRTHHFDILPLAEHFGGGGHKESAGAPPQSKDLDEIITEIKKLLTKLQYPEHTTTALCL